MNNAKIRGTVIDGRFVVERLAGQGGMGQIYRAFDQQTGNLVAVKLMQRLSPDAAQRFGREAELLKELAHPGIVKYIASGLTGDGEMFLAMDWLEGLDLGQKLQRGGITVAESLQLLRQVTDALSAAHERGIVHRDLKPSNIFLVDGQVGKARVLDFGMARHTERPSSMTQTGVVVGSIDYMAPEQARGQRDITVAADVFSLGCILFECLIGKPPFAAGHMVAVLAKILFEEVPPPSSLRPELPVALDTLLQRMLTKDPALRLADARALHDALQAMGTIVVAGDGPPELVPVELPKSLAGGERHLVSIVMARAMESADLMNTVEYTPQLEPPRIRDNREWLRSSFGQFGARAEWLADGALVATLMYVGSATDQVAQAARCALHIHENWGEAAVVLTTGRGTVDMRGSIPIGEALDRAASLIRILTRPGRPAPQGVYLDEVTAGLLDARFSVARKDSLPILHREQVSTDETRLLLGKPTPCLGRESELRMLEMILKDCIEEPRSQAVLVTSAPGFGKSRLRHEYLRRLQNSELADQVQVLFGRCDLMTTGSPYASLSHALWHLCGLNRGDAPKAQRLHLQDRLSRHLQPADRKQVVEFLGELCGVPFPDSDSAQLRAARQDPKVMSDQVCQAFVDFVTAECSHHPVLLVIEDLHWGDALTVKLTDAVLRATSSLPFMVLALARPEVHDLFPNLWTRQNQEIRLRGMGDRAAERLVKQVLGDATDSRTIARIVRQAAGNSLFLEELIRTIAEGNGDKPPETVVAMLQARLSGMAPEIRRLLRAASIFGEEFWERGAQQLCGESQTSENTDALLHHAVEQEIIERSSERRFPSEEQYRFRHALMRDAAYSLLTEEDRRLGHQLAAKFLLDVGEPDPMVLADHHQLGGDLTGAIPYFVRAADQALAGNDLAGTLSRVERGLSCQPKGAELGQLRGLQCVVHFWNDQWATADAYGTEAMALLPVGSFRWCRTLGPMLTLTSLSGNLEHFGKLTAAFTGSRPEPSARTAYTEAASMLVTTFSYLYRRPQAEMIVSLLDQISQTLDANDAAASGWIRQGQVYYYRLLCADPWKTYEVAAAGKAAFLQAGAQRNVIILSNFLGLAQSELGNFAEGEATLRGALASAQTLKESLALLRSTVCLAYLLGTGDDSQKFDEAYTLAHETCNTKGVNSVYLAMSIEVMAAVSLSRGKLTESEELSRRAIEVASRFPVLRVSSTRLLVYALLEQGRFAEASALAEQAVTEIDSLGGVAYAEIGMWLAAAEARQRQGNLPGAEIALRKAWQQIDQRARIIPDPDWQQRFRSRVPINVRVRTLADAWSLSLES